MSATGFGRVGGLDADGGASAVEAGAVFALAPLFLAPDGDDVLLSCLFVSCDDSGASIGSDEGSGARKRGDGGRAGGWGDGMLGMGNSVCAI